VTSLAVETGLRHPQPLGCQQRMAARMRRLARVAAGCYVIQYNGKPVKSIRRAFRLVAAAAKALR
jgi:hypothetical protein